MPKYIFNYSTRKVTGVNRDPQPFEYSLELEGTPILSKTLSEVVGQVQKTDEAGQPLFIFNGEEVTFPEHIIEAVYEDVERQEDVDNDGDLETVKDRVEVSPRKVIVLEPLMVDKLEYYTVTFEDQPFEFNFEEVSKAPIKLSPGDELRKENFELKLAMATMYEESMMSQFELQLAIADLYETVLG